LEIDFRKFGSSFSITPLLHYSITPLYPKSHTAVCVLYLLLYTKVLLDTRIEFCLERAVHFFDRVGA
jgi:hypothetical protein